MALWYRLSLISAVGLSAYLFVRYFSSPAKRYPPGPKGLPLIGNVLQIPLIKPWLTYRKWGRTWGDIVYVTMFGKPIIVVNSLKITMALFEKRSSNYSSRPPTPMAGLSGWGIATGLLPYSDSFRNHRRTSQRGLSADIVSTEFDSLLQSEVVKYLQKLIDHPKDFDAHTVALTASVGIRVIYGYEVERGDDPYVNIALQSANVFEDVTRAGAYLVDFFSPLMYLPKWFPGGGFKRIAEGFAESVNLSLNMPLAWTKKQMEDGISIASFASKLLADGEDEELVRCVSGSLFVGTTHTTATLIRDFILAMMLYPEVQKRAQAQIDEVVGRDRLPSFADRTSLPYVEAVLWEVMRWNPVTPLGGPRASLVDDVYDGYFIPAGSYIIPNVWGFLHDKEVYKDPMQFNPERFLPERGRSPEQDPRPVLFGFGRRVCPGIHLAGSLGWLAVTQILAQFLISKSLDDMGNEIEPSLEFSSALVSEPPPFQCEIVPRFEGAARLISAFDTTVV